MKKSVFMKSSGLLPKEYKAFFLMLGISFAVMYAVMYFNIASLGHVYFSLTRLYMALLMVSPMAVVMLLFMGHMYKDSKLNKVIVSCSVLIFVLTLALLRTQTPVSDEQYVKAMIPHHSSAIMTSQEADIRDPEVRELADQIIVAQEREIKQMEEILDRMSSS